MCGFVQIIRSYVESLICVPFVYKETFIASLFEEFYDCNVNQRIVVGARKSFLYNFTISG